MKDTLVEIAIKNYLNGRVGGSFDEYSANLLLELLKAKGIATNAKTKKANEYNSIPIKFSNSSIAQSSSQAEVPNNSEFLFGDIMEVDNSAQDFDPSLSDPLSRLPGIHQRANYTDSTAATVGMTVAGSVIDERRNNNKMLYDVESNGEFQFIGSNQKGQYYVQIKLVDSEHDKFQSFCGNISQIVTDYYQNRQKMSDFQVSRVKRGREEEMHLDGLAEFFKSISTEVHNYYKVGMKNMDIPNVSSAAASAASASASSHQNISVQEAERLEGFYQTISTIVDSYKSRGEKGESTNASVEPRFGFPSAQGQIYVPPRSPQRIPGEEVSRGG